MGNKTYQIDACSLEKAHALFETGAIDRIEVGTVKAGKANTNQLRQLEMSKQE